MHLGDINKQIEFALTIFGDYGILGIFLAALLLGEIVIFLAFLLSQQGVFNYSEVFILSILSILIVDLFWFYIGRYFPENHIPASFKVVVLRPVNNFITSFTRGRMLTSIITLKFFIGIRIAYMLYLSKQEISLKTLLLYDIVAVILFVLFLSILGTLLGEYIRETLNSYIYVASIGTGIIFFIAATIISKFLIRYKNN